MHKLTGSRVGWPEGRLESLHFCRMGGLAGSEKKGNCEKREKPGLHTHLEEQKRSVKTLENIMNN